MKMSCYDRYSLSFTCGLSTSSCLTYLSNMATYLRMRHSHQTVTSPPSCEEQRFAPLNYLYQRKHIILN